MIAHATDKYHFKRGNMKLLLLQICRMNLHRLENENSILNVFVSEVRDSTIQKDAFRFRKNMERIGEVIAYEISKDITYTAKKVMTPLGNKDMAIIEDTIVICSVLRAGLTLHQGFLNFFDAAESAFVSAYRKEPASQEVEVVVKYAAGPSLDGKVLILVDPMIATGTTLENVLQVLSAFGTPKELHIASVVGSQMGVDKVTKVFPENSSLWIAAIDETLNKKNYIVPGLGDAGDLAFGAKINPKKQSK